MPLKFSMERCPKAAKRSAQHTPDGHTAKIRVTNDVDVLSPGSSPAAQESMLSETTDACESKSKASGKINSKFRMPPPIAKKVSQRFIKVGDVAPTKPYKQNQKVKSAPSQGKANQPNGLAKSKEQRPVTSVLHMLLNSGTAKALPQTSTASASDVRAPTNPMVSEQAYIADVTSKIADGVYRLNGEVWVLPPSPFQKAAEINHNRKLSGEALLNADEVLVLVQLPCLFVWAPEFSFPGLQIHCPSCGEIIRSSTWWHTKVLHSLRSNTMYICRRHTCTNCTKTKGNQCTKSLGDSLEAQQTLPQHIASL